MWSQSKEFPENFRKKPLDRHELFRELIKYFRSQKSTIFFSTDEQLELYDSRKLRETPVSGTLLEPIVQKLNALGAPTESTVGGVMDTLNINRVNIHRLACYCHGRQVRGSIVAERLRELAPLGRIEKFVSGLRW